MRSPCYLCLSICFCVPLNYFSAYEIPLLCTLNNFSFSMRSVSYQRKINNQLLQQLFLIRRLWPRFYPAILPEPQSHSATAPCYYTSSLTWVEEWLRVLIEPTGLWSRHVVHPVTFRPPGPSKCVGHISEGKGRQMYRDIYIDEGMES
jgi:hypothetical protein